MNRKTNEKNEHKNEIVTASEVIRKIMDEKGLSFQKASEQIGLPRRSALSKIVYSKSTLTLSSFIKIMNGLGCSVLVQNRSSKKVFEIQNPETDKEVIAE